MALESAALEHDRITWAPELEAVQQGQKIVALWDDFRRGSNAFERLATVSFSVLHLPASSEPVSIENSIQHRRLDETRRDFSPAEWRALLEEWQRSGYRLEQSEWRQLSFSTNLPKSVFAVELHVAHSATESRHQIRFRLDVEWRDGEFGRLRVHSGEIVSQTGPPQFTPWFSMELPLVEGLETLDPFLAVYDLNQDTRPEIALLVQNMVLRPKGERFAPEDLCAFPPIQPRAGIFADFDHDGLVDYLCATSDRLLLYHGTAEGTFPTVPLPAWIAPETLHNPFVLTAGDVEGDGDLDLFLAQYKLPYVLGQMPTPYFDANDGFPSFLLLNDGRGRFTDATVAGGLVPKSHRRTYSASFVDLDRDEDLDLIVVSDFAGLDLHLNDGTGKFKAITSERVPQPHAFGMAHTLADFDLDGSLEILMIGMNSDAAERLESLGLGRADFPRHTAMRRAMTQGNRLYFGEQGIWRDRAVELGIAQAGWAWGATAFDADADRDPDVYIVNGHNSRETALDYESQFWRHDIYTGNSEPNPAAALFFQSFASKLYGAGWSYGGYHKNKFFLNRAGTNFLEVGYLMGLAVERDCRNLVSADLDGDGDRDLIFTTFEQWPRLRQTLQAYRNEVRREQPPALEVPYVTGDSYRSQHPKR